MNKAKTKGTITWCRRIISNYIIRYFWQLEQIPLSYVCLFCLILPLGGYQFSLTDNYDCGCHGWKTFVWQWIDTRTAVWWTMGAKCWTNSNCIPARMQKNAVFIHGREKCLVAIMHRSGLLGNRSGHFRFNINWYNQYKLSMHIWAMLCSWSRN